MNELLVRPKDIFEIIKRQQKYILRAFLGASAFIMFAWMVLPRSYQGEVILHIGVNYFQNPLISDLVSQTHDPNELKSERGRVIRASLGVDFANKMGEKYKLFTTAANDPARAAEIEAFLKHIDISDVTSTQFQIRFKAKSPAVSDGITRDAIEAIRTYMYVSRLQTLEQLMAVLDGEIRAARDDQAVRSGVPISLVGTATEAGKAQLASQISTLENRLQDLLRTYNDGHPAVQGVKAEIAELRSIEKNGATGNSSALTRRHIFQKGEGAMGATIRDNLIKQRHLVNIALEMDRKDAAMTSYISLIKEPIYPKNPIFPQLKLFLLFAVAAGVMAATAVAALREFWQGTALPPRDVAETIGIELLGTITMRQ